ncbi:MAG: prolyl oligopeptidase family serine peptidase [Hyphomonadaceae bacterium]|nr:prolyl oligopeptidase family serine peptidase [Hyphomonadaceae bacterium]
MKRLIAIAAVAGLLPLSSFAAPEPIPTEVWADTTQVQSLDMSPNAERMAMLMRRDRGADHEILIFDTDDIKGSLKAIEADGLRALSLAWVNDDYLVINFILETEEMGRPVNYRRTASYNVETEEWTSLVLTTNRANPRDPMDQFMGNLGIGRVVNTLPDDPNHVLVSHTEEAGLAPNYYRTNVKTGARTRTLRGGGRFSSFTFDREGQARGAQEYDAAANRIITYARESESDEWVEIGSLDADKRDTFGLLGFYDEDRPYIATAVATEPGGNHTVAYDIDIRTGEREMIFGVEGYDTLGVLTSPRLSDGSKIVGFTYSDNEGTQRYFLDGQLAALHDGLSQAFPGRSVQIRRMSEDGQTVLAYTRGPRDPGTWYLVKDGKVAPVIGANSEIPKAGLSETHVLEYTARDGMELVGYVTVPHNSEGPFPAIAMPHGGPWVRDNRDYDRWAQMLANQGYVVFQPNYRGSDGLGKDYWMAGDNKWGYEMQDDVEDGIQTLIDQGIADPERLGFFGWSYGGYSAFVGATRDDPMFNCFVAGAGVADIGRIRGGLTGSRFAREFQKPTISGVNPIELVENVTKPMLLVHGDYDSIVPVEHSRRFADGLERINADYEYIEIEDMGHSPFELEENMQWFPALFEFFDTKCGF